ncbi:PAS domain S-box protein [Longimicrobium sp.]|uniref:PAS domain S-box protein n=1 Tax=Longimicrobium sp. TaxID=2029185 RepID=UPI002E326FA6|nr:PAS domain S-box protein [Longimicrobium sp.]HEX6037283.1 PAS domain S-box protein [Longimicrobium sp.]
MTEPTHAHPPDANARASTPPQPPLASVEWDADGRVARWSPEAEALFGWSADEVRGRTASQWPIIHPDDVPQVRQVASDLAEGRARQTFSANRNLTRDGRVLHCEWYNTAIVDSRGVTLGQLSLVLDVTERVRAEQRAEHAAGRTRSLQAITELLSEALTPAQVAGVVMDQGIGSLAADAGVLVLVTADGAHLEVLASRGYAPGRIEGWQRFPLDAGVPIADAARTGEVVVVRSFEERATRYPAIVGQAGDHPMSVSVPLVVEGERVGAMGLSFRAPHVFGDDDRAFMLALGRQCAQAVRRARLYQAEHRARAAAEESERQFRLLAESIPQLAWMADETGSLTWYNQRWYDYTGTTWEQMRGWGWRSVHHPDELPGVEARFRRAIQAGEPWEDTFPLRGADGAFRRFLSRALPLRDEAGRIVRWFGTNTDVEENLRALEGRAQALAEAQAARTQAEEASRAKSVFLATMSHEIRTPINAVIGYAELLDMGLQGPLNDGQRGYLDRIRVSSQHLLGLVNDVLDFAKIEAGQMGVAREHVLLRDAASDAINMVLPQATARGIEVREEPCDAEAAYVGDRDRVRQILLNLLSNAVKFTRPGGTVSVRCWGDAEPLPGVHPPQPGPYACIEVEDTGIGIAPEQLARVFEPFTQVDDTHTRETGGTGLGLAISRRFARLMGGELSARSRPGLGSVFTLWLPGFMPEEPAAADEWPRDAGEIPGLAAAARMLEEQVERVLDAWVERMGRDAGVPHAHGLERELVEDHTISYIVEVARALITLDATGGEPVFMRDGESIQRTIASLHGAQRARLGFTTDEVAREYVLLGEVIEEHVQDAAMRAGADPAPIVVLARRLLDRGARVAAEAHASIPDSERLLAETQRVIDRTARTVRQVRKRMEEM